MDFDGMWFQQMELFIGTPCSLCRVHNSLSHRTAVVSNFTPFCKLHVATDNDLFQHNF